MPGILCQIFMQEQAAGQDFALSSEVGGGGHS